MSDIAKQLTRNEADLLRNPKCADLWVMKARLLMLGDSATLAQVEKCILKALSLSPNNLEAIEEAAHYYDVMKFDRRKAVKYAKRYVQLAGKVVSDMQAILDDPN
jgi:hypothetical protein